jgi:hypothetical protein
MKTAWYTVPALAVLALACSDSTSPNLSRSSSAAGGLLASSANGNGVVHRVSVGGSDQDATQNTDANFSLIALQKGDGSMSGEWTDQFGQGQGGVHVDVNCVFVAGNQAWVSGIIRSGNFQGADLSGLPAITRVADLGKSANDPPDAISFTFIGVAAPCTAQPNLPLLAMTGGQVTID